MNHPTTVTEEALNSEESWSEGDDEEDETVGMGGRLAGPGGNRPFQSFWCGQDDSEEAADISFPKPDTYGFRGGGVSGGGPHHRNNNRASIRNRLELMEIVQNNCSGDVQYAPKRPPPLLDFAFVFTSFVAALVFAYYTTV